MPQWTVIIGSGNGLVPMQHQTITWTSDYTLLIAPLVINFIEICIKT